MKRKRNIYDADDAAKSKRLHFSAEERAAHAEKKAEILGEKLEKAKADLPKKRRARINREFDAMTGKVRHSLSFEDEVKPRSRKNPVARAGLKAGRTVDLAAHSIILDNWIGGKLVMVQIDHAVRAAHIAGGNADSIFGNDTAGNTYYYRVWRYFL